MGYLEDSFKQGKTFWRS